MPGALDDITVLELANWVAAPSTAVLMADMGARVIKVEPLGGDPMRNIMPQPEGAPPLDHPFQIDNRGKESIAVAINDPRGADLVRAVAERVDVVITNLLPGRAAHYGLDPETLLAANPRLVYGRVTGYGPVGPEADRSGYDQTAYFGRTGVVGLLGEPDSPPIRTRAGQGDHPTGLALLVAVLAALRARDRSGLGQVVETALVSAGLWTIAHDLQTALVDGKQPERYSRANAGSPMTTTFRCADGRWLNLCGTDQRRWGAFCTALGRPDLGDDPRFATPTDRYVNRGELLDIFEAIFASAPADEWATALHASGVPWEKVAELPEVVKDEQLRAIGAFVELHHPEGSFETVAAPFTMSASEVRARGMGPLVGEHTADVLADLGVDSERVAELASAGVVGLGS